MTKRFVGVALVLAAVGAFALVVGSHDVFAAQGLRARLFGAFLAAGGLIMVIAAAGIFRRAAWHVALSLVGSFAALLVGVALLLAQWEAEARDAMLLLWAGVVLASLVALGLSLRPGAPHVTSAVRRIQLVAVAGMLVGIAQFVFTNVYGPVQSGPHLTVTSSLERVGVKRLRGRPGLLVVKARLTLANTSERKIVLVDSSYRITGHNVVGRAESGTSLGRLEKAVKTASPEVDNADAVFDSKVTSPTLIRAGQILSRGYWFEPQETTTREFIVYAPVRSHDLIRLSAIAHIADSGRLDVDEPVEGPTVEKSEGESAVITRWNIRETSWVRRLTHKESVLWSHWVLREGFMPVYDVYIDEKGKELDPNAQRFPRRVIDLSNEYGLLWIPSEAELSVAPNDG